MKGSDKFQKYFEQPKPSPRKISSNGPQPQNPPPQQGKKSDQDIMDLKIVINRVQKSRITEIERPRFIQSSNKRKVKFNSLLNKQPIILEDIKQQNVYQKVNRSSNNNSERDEFLPKYQKKGLKSILLFALFVIAILTETIISVYTFQKDDGGGIGEFSIIIIILSSQVLYDYLQKAIRGQNGKAISMKERWKAEKELWGRKGDIQSAFAVLYFIGSILSFFCYLRVMEEQQQLFTEEQPSYLICDLFWANVVVSVLSQKFIFGRTGAEAKKPKVVIFAILIIALSITILTSSFNLFFLWWLKVGMVLLKSLSKNFELGWVGNLANVIILLLAFVWTVFINVGKFMEDRSSFISIVLLVCSYTAYITVGMLVTRFLVRVYLEKYLFQKLYNEAHINIAFVLSATLITLPYFFSSSLLTVSLRLALNTAIIGIIYLDAHESFQIALTSTVSDYETL